MVAKIGRNAPCPCGSGIKYKKCCMNKQAAKPALSNGIRKTHWSLKEINSLSTDTIISKLKSFGVPFDQDQFLEDVEKFYSGEELANNWRKQYPISARGLDMDFLWMAAIILWKRFAPDLPSSEMLDDMMQHGYQLLGSGGSHPKTVEACNIWLEVWEHLKKRFTSDMKSIDDAERVFAGMQSLFNWCQDLEMELHNAGLDEPAFIQKRIDYCHEFCELFPESDELILHNMKRAEAEAHFALGRAAEGDRLFAALIEQYPHNPWGYIGWGDMYADELHDMDRARQLYQMGLNPMVKDQEDIRDRLQTLEGKS